MGSIQHIIDAIKDAQFNILSALIIGDYKNQAHYIKLQKIIIAMENAVKNLTERQDSNPKNV